MWEAYEQTVELQTMLEIAEALRGELGEQIDAQPGGASTEAGQVNRSLQVTARCILRRIASLEEELPGLLTWTLRWVVENRLVAAGISGTMISSLLDLEPSLEDAWPTYLALASASVIQDLIEAKA